MAVAVRYDPASEVAAHPEWTVVDHPGVPELGRWYAEFQTILLDAGLNRAARRSTLAHEVEHALRDDRPYHDAPAGWFTRRREWQVERAAARKLVPVSELCEALEWTTDPAELAAELDIDQASLTCRLATLTPHERRTVRRRLRRSAP